MNWTGRHTFPKQYQIDTLKREWNKAHPFAAFFLKWPIIGRMIRDRRRIFVNLELGKF